MSNLLVDFRYFSGVNPRANVRCLLKLYWDIGT